MAIIPQYLVEHIYVRVNGHSIASWNQEYPFPSYTNTSKTLSSPTLLSNGYQQ